MEGGWLAVIGFGFVAVMSAARTIWRSTVLRIDDTGFEDPWVGLGTIPWDAVAGVETRRLLHTQLLCIELKQPEIWLPRRPRGQQLVAQINAALGYPEFFVSLAATNANAEDLVRVFRQRSGLFLPSGRGAPQAR